MIKDGIKQFAAILIYGAILYIGMTVQDKLYDDGTMTFKLLPSFLFSVVFPIIFGLTLGIPNYLNELKKEGLWSVEQPKLVFVCIPTLFVGLAPVLRWYPPFNQFSFLNLFLGKSGISQLTYISGIAFGYFLLSSLRKCSKVQQTKTQNLDL